MESSNIFFLKKIYLIYVKELENLQKNYNESKLENVNFCYSIIIQLFLSQN